MFVINNEAKSFNYGGGITTKVLSNGEGLTMIESCFEAGSDAPLHAHSNEQTGYVIKGKFEFEIDGKKTVLSEGDSFYVEPNLSHGCKALEDSIFLDVFSPARKDFLEKIK